MKTHLRLSLALAMLTMCVTLAAQPNGALMKSMNDMMGRMRQVKMSGSLDADFARLMGEHHQGAIDMSKAYLAIGKDEELKNHARQAIEKRKKEQKQLEIFTMSKNAGGSQDLMNGIDKMMKSMQAIAPSGNVDRDFALMMMAHNDGGIELAQKEASRGQNAALKKLAASIAEDQRQSKQKLQRWISSSAKGK